MRHLPDAILSAPTALLIVLITTTACVCAQVAHEVACTNNATATAPGVTPPPIMMLSNTMYTLRDCNQSILLSHSQDIFNVSVSVVGGTVLPAIQAGPSYAFSNLRVDVLGVHCTLTNWSAPLIVVSSIFGSTVAAHAQLSVSIVESTITVEQPGISVADIYPFILQSIALNVYNVSLNVTRSNIRVVADHAAYLFFLAPLAGGVVGGVHLRIVSSTVAILVNCTVPSCVGRVFILFLNGMDHQGAFSDVNVLVDSSQLRIETYNGYQAAAWGAVSTSATGSFLEGLNVFTMLNTQVFIKATFDAFVMNLNKLAHAEKHISVMFSNVTLELVLHQILTETPRAAAVALTVKSMPNGADVTLRNVRSTVIALYDTSSPIILVTVGTMLVVIETVTVANLSVLIASSSLNATQQCAAMPSSSAATPSPIIIQIFQSLACYIDSEVTLENTSVALHDVHVNAATWFQQKAPSSLLDPIYIITAVHAIIGLNSSFHNRVTVAMSDSSLTATFMNTTAAPSTASSTSPSGQANALLVSLANAASISSAQIGKRFPLIFPSLPSDIKGKLAACRSVVMDIVNCTIVTRIAMFSELTQAQIALLTIPNDMSGSRFVFANTTVVHERPNGALAVALPAILCAAPCSMNNASSITFVRVVAGSLNGPLCGIVAGSTTTTTATQMIIVNSTLAFLGIVTNMTTWSALWDERQNVVIGTGSVLHFDGCIFRNYSKLFGSGVIWDATASSSLRPRVLMGCNQQLPIAAPSISAAIPPPTFPPNVFVVVEYPRDDFSSPYLPTVVCPGGRDADITVVRGDVPTWPLTTTSVVDSNAVVAAVIIAQGLLAPLSGAGAVHSIQAALLSRRKALMCAAAIANDDDQGSVNVDQGGQLCCDAGTNPLQLTIGSTEAFNTSSTRRIDHLAAEFIGAVVGNTVLVLAVLLCRMLLIAAGQLAAVRECHIALLQRLRDVFTCPVGPISALWMPYTMLSAPTVATALALVIVQGSSTADIIIGVVAMVAWLVPWAVVFGAICWRRGSRAFPFRGVVPRGRLRRTILQHLLDPAELLDAPAAARPYARELFHEYAPVFEAYRAQRYWYFNVEVACSVATGAVMGAAYGEALVDPCSAWCEWLLVAIGVAEVVAGLAVRPFTVALDAVGLAVVGGLSILSQLVTLISSDDNGNAAYAADGLALASSLVELLLLVLSLISLFIVGTQHSLRFLTIPTRSVLEQKGEPRIGIELPAASTSRKRTRRDRGNAPLAGNRQHHITGIVQKSQAAALKELIELCVAVQQSKT